MKLSHLCQYFGASGRGVDPSPKAVKDGNDSFVQQGATNIKLEVGTAAALAYPDQSFDLVYFGFCLYLVDRDEIYRVVAEADRVLKKGGFLAVLDFDPAVRHKRPYHHQPGLFSFKTQYSNFFVANGHYHLVAKESFSHGTAHFAKDSDERVSVDVLFKEIDAY